MSKHSQRKASYYKLGYNDALEGRGKRFMQNKWVHYKDYAKGYSEGIAEKQKSRTLWAKLKSRTLWAKLKRLFK